MQISLSASLPEREYPITSFSTSSTVTDRTFNVFSSIDEEETKSLKLGGSFTLTTSIVIFADTDVHLYQQILLLMLSV